MAQSVSQTDELVMNAAARSFTPSYPVAALPDAEPATPSAATALELTMITGRAAFDALEAEWNALFDRAGRPAQVFQTFNWNWHWANHYLDGAPGGISGLQLAIVTGRRNAA